MKPLQISTCVKRKGVSVDRSIFLDYIQGALDFHLIASVRSTFLRSLVADGRISEYH